MCNKLLSLLVYESCNFVNLFVVARNCFLIKMKYFDNVISVWILSVLILMIKLTEAAVVNQTNLLNNISYPDDAKQSTDMLNNVTSSHHRTSRKMNVAPCQEGISIKCIKMEIVQYIDQLAEKDEIDLLPGLEIVKDNNIVEETSADIAAEIARKYPNDATSRLNVYILTKLTNYMQSHHLRLKLLDDKAITEARSFSESARSKGKKGGGMEALIAAGIAMKGTLMALALGALALLAGKALTAALMALMLAAAVGLKSMDGGKEVKYEIISKPIHTSSHKHHDDQYSHNSAYAAYGRSLQLEKPSH